MTRTSFLARRKKPRESTFVLRVHQTLKEKKVKEFNLECSGHEGKSQQGWSLILLVRCPFDQTKNIQINKYNIQQMTPTTFLARRKKHERALLCWECINSWSFCPSHWFWKVNNRTTKWGFSMQVKSLFSGSIATSASRKDSQLRTNSFWSPN